MGLGGWVKLTSHSGVSEKKNLGVGGGDKSFSHALGFTNDNFVRAGLEKA